MNIKFAYLAMVNSSFARLARAFFILYVFAAVFTLMIPDVTWPFTPYSLLPHFDVLCDLLLNKRTATWNLFV